MHQEGRGQTTGLPQLLRQLVQLLAMHLRKQRDCRAVARLAGNALHTAASDGSEHQPGTGQRFRYELDEELAQTC